MHRINITEFHILNGKILGFDDCPVALALRGFYETSDVSVGANGFRIMKFLFDFGDNVKNFIMRFDAGKKVSPMVINMPFSKEQLHDESTTTH